MYMYLHELDPKKGHPSPYALDKRGLLDVSVDTAAQAFAGMCAHLSPSTNPAGKLRLGVPSYAPTTGTAPMPIFLLRSGTDFDVSVDTDAVFGTPGAKNSTGYASSNAIATLVTGLTPVLSGLVATGAFELATTEYTGVPTTGTLLTAPDNAADSTNKGKLKMAANAGSIAANTIIVGCVSDGVVSNDQPGGPSKLVFWPCFMVKGL